MWFYEYIWMDGGAGCGWLGLGLAQGGEVGKRVYLGQVIDEQSRCNAQSEDEHIRKVFRGNGAALAQQHAEQRNLGVRVRRITAPVIQLY